MATNTLDLRIILKGDTAENWAKSTLVLLKNEYAIETDTRKAKIGDGVNVYKDLKYATITPEEVSQLISAANHSHSNKAILDGTTASFTTALKTKLDGIAANAEVNQNAFTNVKVGTTTVSADTKTDTLELVAGSNVTITPDATNDKVTISSKDTIYTHPTTSGNKHIPSGGSAGQFLKWSADGTAVWGSDNNTTYGAAGTSLGLVKTGGDVTITDGVIAVNDDSHNHVIENIDGLQGTIDSMNTAIEGKAPTGHTHNYAGSASAGGAANSANKLSAARTITLTGDVTGSTTSDLSGNVSIATDVENDSHTHSNATITSLDASKLTGTVPIERLPQGALERLVTVADDTARFKLTTANVQLGDTVKVTSTGLMYYVKDQAKLSTEDGYEIYTAGSATSVPWSGVTGRPSTMKNPTALTVQFNGTTNSTYDGATAQTVNITPSGIGAAPASHGTHVTYATAVAKPNGTAATGTSANVAREDHVHPLQTSVSGSSGSCTGNSASATKLATKRNISISGGVTASANQFDGTGDVALNVTKVNMDFLSNGTSQIILNCGDSAN